MADIKTKYAAAASLTITLNSLASSATAGRESTYVDNATNLYLDAMVTLALSYINSATANDKTVYVWAYGYDNTSAYTGGVTGSDAAYTRKDPTSLRLIGTAFATLNTTDLAGPFSVAAAFGGILPVRWGIVVQNYTGQTLQSSGNSASFVGIHGQTV